MTDTMPTRQGAALPSPLTSFVGRERDIKHVTDLLQREVRLVTLTGPGGVGKTRLALRVAHNLQHDFADGVAFVPLAPITDPELVCSTIAQALGVREQSDRPAQTLLAEALRDRELLLVLDNFEQIVEAAPLLTALLGPCPGLRLLVTSRILLRLSGEHDVPVRPLSLPDPTVPLPYQGDAEAMHLFMDRARAAAPTFALTADNTRAVAAICQRLDGLPLALELVAAKVRLLPPQALLPRLAQALPLLTGGRRDDPARLRTMRDAIAWSYELLTPALQTLFCRLAICTGGFTLEAAAAIAGGANDTEMDILAGVESLLEHSLIHQTELAPGSRGDPRFGMLETVREFGLERLAAMGEAGAMRHLHARYFLLVAEAVEPDLLGSRQGRALTRLEADLANLRAALSWFQEHDYAEEALRLAGALGRFWFLQGRYGEGQAHLDNSFTLPGVIDHAVRAKALTWACLFTDWLGDYAHAVALGDEAVAIRRTLDDQRGLAESLRVLTIALIQVDIARAEAVGTESLQLFRILGDDLHVAEALDGLGVAAYARGDYVTAAAYMEQGLPAAREANDPEILGSLVGDLGHVSMVLGDDHRARLLLGEGLAIHRELGDRYWIAWHLACLAGVVINTQPERAARLFGAAAAIRADVGAPWRPSVQAVYAPMLARTQEALGDTAFAEAWGQGEALPLEEAISEGLAVVSEPGEAASEVQPVAPLFGLTPREEEVLRLVAAGHANGEIAAMLFISGQTVKRHVSTILSKLDLPSRAAAVAFAHTHGLS